MSLRTLFAPHTVEIHKDNLSIKEDLLWDLRGNRTLKEAASTLCSQLRLPSSEEKEIGLQLERTVRAFRDTGAGAPMVVIRLHVPLGGDLVLVDKVTWDLNNPRFTAEMHAAALCADFGLHWVHFSAITRTLKARIDACRKELKSGGGRVELAPPPHPVTRQSPNGYPAIMRLPKRARTSAAEGTTPINGERSAATPFKAEPGTATPIKAESDAAAPIKAEPGTGAPVAHIKPEPGTAAMPLQPTGAALREPGMQQAGSQVGSLQASQEGGTQDNKPAPAPQPGAPQQEVGSRQGGNPKAGSSAGVQCKEEVGREDSDMPDLGFA